jgi:hypothetical protein
VYERSALAIGSSLRTERVPLSGLRPHPRNYRAHPDDQIEHLAESLKEHGQYRNIVIARDGTILAGHGVVQAAQSLGLTELDAVRLDLSPDEPRALKLLAADNTLGHLAEQDDRALSELLKEIGATDPMGLLGTGFDEAMLANLLFVTRPRSEIRDFDEAAHWAGMPEYEAPQEDWPLTVRFRTRANRDAFEELTGLHPAGNAKMSWWPSESADDLRSLRFEQASA